MLNCFDGSQNAPVVTANPMLNLFAVLSNRHCVQESFNKVLMLAIDAYLKRSFLEEHRISAKIPVQEPDLTLSIEDDVVGM